MSRRISGFKPTGRLQLGNYIGAIRPMVDAQAEHECIAFVADLHAMTVPHDPDRLHALTREVATLLLACGAEPEHLFIQSQVPQTLHLHYLLECATTYGEAHRMIQFKEKATGAASTRLSLLTYPVLMAADILVHDVDEVPVGDDQDQHVELTRDVAIRFNGRYSETFRVPKAVNPEVAARVKDLSDPGAKMGKTNSSDAGALYLLDPPHVLRRKVMRAVTDTDREVSYDPDGRPGVANLLEILAALRQESPVVVAGRFESYGGLKAAVADEVVGAFTPIQRRYAELVAAPEVVDASLRRAAAAARRRARATVARAARAMGLVAP